MDGTGHCKHRLDFRASKYQTVKDASQIDLSMDTYYQNGEFVAADATVAGDNECTDASIALFNEAFNALHEIYAKQGCPFK